MSLSARPAKRGKPTDGFGAGRESTKPGGRWLRVVLLADGETVHNAFFDRDFEP